MPILSSNIAELTDGLKKFENDYETQLATVKAEVVRLRNENEKLCGRADSIEEKMRQRPAVPSEGGRFAEELMLNRAFQDRPKSLGRNQAVQFTISAKAALSGITRTLPRLTGVVASGPSQAFRLRSVIPQVPIGEGAITYTRETGFTNLAAPVAELAAKPESTLTYANVTAPAETIAHWTAISKPCYEDSMALAAAVEDRLLYGLIAVEENQLLNGNGTPPQLTGYMTVATAHAAFLAGTSLFDCLAITAAEQTALGFPPTACVVNATDWTTLALAKSAVEKQYLVLPEGLLPPIVVSPSMAAGSFLVGAFNLSTLFVRTEATIQVAYQNVDDFTHNRLTILAELREVLAIYQAAAFVKGTIPAPALVL